MKSFEFQGEWKTKLRLEEFSNLRNPKFYNENSHLEWIREKAKSLSKKLIDFDIFASPSTIQVPEENQISAINYLLNNEIKILRQILVEMKNRIYPIYSDLSGHNYSDEVPLASIDDLYNAIAISNISVHYLGKKGLSYTTYTFESIVDYEHGLSMLFEGDKFIRFDAAGEISYEKVLSSEDYDKYFRETSACYNSKNPQLYYPVKGYAHYKPWQLLHTKAYLINLLKNRNFEKFSKIINSHNFNINLEYPEHEGTLLEDVLEYGDIEIAIEMINLGANYNYEVTNANLYKNNITRIHLHKELGFDIDQKDSNGRSLLDKYLELYENSNNTEEIFKLAQEHIYFLTQNGARINSKWQYYKYKAYKLISRN